MSESYRAGVVDERGYLLGLGRPFPFHGHLLAQRVPAYCAEAWTRDGLGRLAIPTTRDGLTGVMAFRCENCWAWFIAHLPRGQVAAGAIEVMAARALGHAAGVRCEPENAPPYPVTYGGPPHLNPERG